MSEEDNACSLNLESGVAECIQKEVPSGCLEIQVRREWLEMDLGRIYTFKSNHFVMYPEAIEMNVTA